MLGTLTITAASLHCVQSLVVFALVSYLDTRSAFTSMTGVFPLTRAVTVWAPPTAGDGSGGVHGGDHMGIGNFSVSVTSVPTGWLDCRYAVAFFFLLSALFQGAATPLAVVGGERAVRQMARLRLLEYSISASLMMLAISVEVGISDLYILSQAFVLTFVCMLLGMVADIFEDIQPPYSTGPSLATAAGLPECLPLDPQWLWVGPHVTGWLCMAAVWVPILDAFTESQKLSVSKAPSFVHAIVAVESFLFLCFGLVQLWSLCRKSCLKAPGSLDFNAGCCSAAGCCPAGCCGSSAVGKHERLTLADKLLDVSEAAEQAYVVLSFVAKTLLGWLILSPLLVSAG